MSAPNYGEGKDNRDEYDCLADDQTALNSVVRMILLNLPLVQKSHCPPRKQPSVLTPLLGW